MEYVRLGNSGLKVSRIALGMMTYGDPAWRPWTLGEKETRPMIAAALEQGINFFDTADMYSRGESEKLTGKFLGEMAKRDEVIIASKVYWPMGDAPNAKGLSRKHILDSIDGTLKRLGTDHVDLYYIHRWDYETPIEEVMQTLDDIVRAGKARYIGASSMYAWQFAKAQFTADIHGWTRFVAMQNLYNLMYREEEREMIPLCLDMGVGVIPWSPLARGILAGSRTRDGEKKTTRAKTDTLRDAMVEKLTSWDVADVLFSVAKDVGIKPAQAALAWLAGRPGVTAPVIGATKVTYIDDAVAALDIRLDDTHLERLETAYVPQITLSHS